MSRRGEGRPDERADEPGLRKRSRLERRLLDRTRTRVKQGQEPPQGALQGVVITPVGPRWVVAVDDELMICSVSGILDAPHESSLVAVGDAVWLVPEQIATDEGDRSGVIVKVEQRLTVLSRKVAGRERREQVLAANVDAMAIVMSCTQPDYNKRLIDRYLIAADKGDLEPLIIINKLDLFDEEYHNDVMDDLRVYWEVLGIPVILTSVATGLGMAQLEEVLRDRMTLLSGPSGVGKSSIINEFSDLQQSVGDISRKYEKGRHTTTAAIVIPLRNGGSVVDTPGIRELAIWELGADELPFYFEEFAPFAEQCKFTPCSHTHEPGCAVKAAVEDGFIDEERYVSYLNLRAEIGSY
ncbi:MAG: ribosome small subunit-dependent GTPase A [Candidatus Kapabacteria bacterium]|nr:ribosome small subunit-dependent GTPase A [Candidatus Kapabacteria bacterium]